MPIGVAPLLQGRSSDAVKTGFLHRQPVHPSKLVRPLTVDGLLAQATRPSANMGPYMQPVMSCLQESLEGWTGCPHRQPVHGQGPGLEGWTGYMHRQRSRA